MRQVQSEGHAKRASRVRLEGLLIEGLGAREPRTYAASGRPQSEPRQAARAAARSVVTMHEIPPEAREYLMPNRQRFAADPFGYSALAWHRWGLAREISGFPVDLEASANSDELKSPVLWLAHARALSEAAVAVVKCEPQFDSMPDLFKGVCDSQYCAVGLMLVGYSLETCLKAMLIIGKGVEAYSEEEKAHRHHRLEELASIVPNLGPKDKAILRTLAHFVTWAGRYPDPGSGREQKLAEVFQAAEKHRTTAGDVFALAARIMQHAKQVVG